MSSAAALWILAILATVFFLRSASNLLIPIAVAVLISYALEPIVAWLSRHGLPRLVGAGLILLIVAATLGWGVYSLQDDVAEAAEALPQAARRAREIVWRGSATGPAASIQQAVEELEAGAGASAGGPSAARAGGAGPSTVTDMVQRAAGSAFALAGHLVAVFFLVFFLLLSGNHFGKRLVEIAGPGLKRRNITAQIIDDVNSQIQRFLLVQLVTAAVVAAATWAVLAWMQVGQAAVWGIMAGVFNSIPYFGPVIVSGGLLVVGFVQSGDPMHAVTIAGATLAITSLEGWLLTPALLGRAEGMNALVVFLGLLLWTWIWGAWGTILAVPMLVIVKAVADHVEVLKPVSRLMAP